MARNFREARLKSGKSVQDVVKALGVTDAAVYQWETGDATPKVENLLKLSSLFGVSTDYLLGNDPSSPVE